MDSKLGKADPFIEDVRSIDDAPMRRISGHGLRSTKEEPEV
jgi:hypothetical protein